MPITAADRVVAQAVTWLWPDRIPLGKLLILDGDPDLGRFDLWLPLQLAQHGLQLGAGGLPTLLRTARQFSGRRVEIVAFSDEFRLRMFGI